MGWGPDRAKCAKSRSRAQVEGPNKVTPNGQKSSQQHTVVLIPQRESPAWWQPLLLRFSGQPLFAFGSGLSLPTSTFSSKPPYPPSRVSCSPKDTTGRHGRRCLALRDPLVYYVVSAAQQRHPRRHREPPSGPAQTSADFERTALHIQLRLHLYDAHPNSNVKFEIPTGVWRSPLQAAPRSSTQGRTS